MVIIKYSASGFFNQISCLQRLKFQNFFVIINRDLKAADFLACIKLYRNCYDVSRFSFLIIYMKLRIYIFRLNIHSEKTDHA